MRRRRGAFTLVELLVVIAIISLLASLLVPSLKKVAESARLVVCASNQRSIGLAINLYHDDYNDYFPNSTWAGGGYRCNISLLWPYGIYPSKGIYYCASAEEYLDMTREKINELKAAGSGWNTYDYCGKYSMRYNSYLGYWDGGSWIYPLRKTSDVKAPIVVMFCGEQNPICNLSPWPWSEGIASFRPGGSAYENYGLDLPHEEESNILWADGSVSLSFDITNYYFWDFSGDHH